MKAGLNLLSFTLFAALAIPAHAANDLGGGVPAADLPPGMHPSPAAPAGSTGATQLPGGPVPSGAQAGYSPQFGLTPWSNQAQYQECNQSCLLKKANETLTLQALYIQHQIEGLNDLWDQAYGAYGAGQKKGATDKLMAEVHSYCPDQPLTGTTPGDVRPCLQRYVLAQIPILRGIKSAIAQNMQSQLSYRADIASVSPDGTVVRRPVSSFQVMESGQVPLLPQTTYVPSLSDIQQQEQANQQSKSQNYFATESYNNWYQKNRPPRPDKSDFIVWQKIQIDPNDPTQGYSVVPLVKGGKIQYDETGFRKARDRYKKRMKELKKLVAKYGDSPSPVNRPETPHADKDYGKAYDDYVNQNNAYLLSHGVAVMSVGKRSPAAASAATPVQLPPTLQRTELTEIYTPEQIDQVIQEPEALLSKLGYTGP